jgi:hypothetical protein
MTSELSRAFLWNNGRYQPSSKKPEKIRMRLSSVPSRTPKNLPKRLFAPDLVLK